MEEDKNIRKDSEENLNTNKSNENESEKKMSDQKVSTII